MSNNLSLWNDLSLLGKCVSIDDSAAAHVTPSVPVSSWQRVASSQTREASSTRHRADRGRGFERTAHCIASTFSGPRASGIEWTARRPPALHHMDPVRCLARGQRLRVCGARSLSARRVGRARYRADHGSQRTPRDCRRGIV